MLRKALVSFLAVFVLAFLYACSSSGSDSGGSGNSGGAGEVSVSGKVIHSSFSNQDKVCFDRNGNKQCDAGEPSASIKSDGTFTVKGAETDVSNAALIAELASTGVATASYSIKAAYPPLVFETPAGQTTLSSITTIIKAKMDQEGISFECPS